MINITLHEIINTQSGGKTYSSVAVSEEHGGIECKEQSIHSNQEGGAAAASKSVKYEGKTFPAPAPPHAHA